LASDETGSRNPFHHSLSSVATATCSLSAAREKGEFAPQPA
jgi:hypothetical protein